LPNGLTSGPAAIEHTGLFFGTCRSGLVMPAGRSGRARDRLPLLLLALRRWLLPALLLLLPPLPPIEYGKSSSSRQKSSS
jgi:hypothetical protein